MVPAKILTRIVIVSLIALGWRGTLEMRAEEPTRSRVPRHVIPDSEAIKITADSVTSQSERDGSQVHILRGNASITQGLRRIEAPEIVLWQIPENGGSRLQAYLKQEYQSRSGHVLDTEPWAEMFTRQGVEIQQTERAIEQVTPDDSPVYREAVKYRLSRQLRPPSGRTNVRQGHALTSDHPSSVVQIPTLPVPVAPKSARRVRLSSRSTTRYNFSSFEDTRTTPAEQIVTITDGVRLVVEGVEKLEVLDLTADRVVIWTRSLDQQGIQAILEQGSNAPLQIYLEGNIIIRQGQSELRANRAFYDLREDRALLLDGELKIKTAQLAMPLRLRGERIRQLSSGSFFAEDAWVSTSKFGKPGYRLQASDIHVEQGNSTQLLAASHTEVDEETGLPVENADPWVTSQNNSLWIEDYPIAYVPFLAAPLGETSGSFPKVTVGNDRIFGTQVRTVTNLMNLAKIKLPAGNEVNLSADYLSKRGPAGGLNGRFQGFDPFGLGSEISGDFLTYGISDSGLDNLGADRRSLVPPDELRGRAQMHFKEKFSDEMSLEGEIGYLSDRNFLEQYYEREFDTLKDNETLLNFKYLNDTKGLSVLGRYLINDFDSGTSWLPKADLYFLGEPLFNGRLTLSSRMTAGYGQLQVGAYPTDPNDIYTPLPYIANVEGAVLSTRHEISAPFNLGPLTIAPYAMGEAAYWSQDMNGDDLGRLYGSAGVRGSFMMWRAFPDVHSDILGLRELAHKMVFDFDYSISDSSTSMSDVPQYNEFDDQAQYRFRNRLITNTFGGVLPNQFAPRFYALRSGAAHNVTSPYWELVDSQQVLRLGWRHRLQTKTGPFDNQRIKDWMTLDLEAALFPNSMRDNFGEDWGLLSGRYAWYIGDRTTFLANAYYDTFDNAQQLWSLGLISQRSTRGSVYLGVRQVKGASLNSQIMTASYSYQMTEKWISTMGTAYDLGEQKNRGQSFTLSRVGSDFIWHIGGNYDVSRNNLGVAVSLEPRFWSMPGSTTQSSNQLGSLLQSY